MKEQRLRKKARKRGYHASNHNPLQIEKVVKGIGRTLNKVFAKESAFLSTRKIILQNSLYEDIEKFLLLMSEEEFLKWIGKELEYCSDRWNLLRYKRFTFFIKKFKGCEQ